MFKIQLTMIAFIQERIIIVNWFRFFYSGFFMINKKYITSERTDYSKNV